MATVRQEARAAREAAGSSVGMCSRGDLAEPEREFPALLGLVGTINPKKIKFRANARKTKKTPPTSTKTQKHRKNTKKHQKNTKFFFFALTREKKAKKKKLSRLRAKK
jgi:hypothetical protein